MATPRKTWTDEQADEARSLMEAFCTADEVCAAMGCGAERLDDLCRRAFGAPWAEASATLACAGRARLRRRLMADALDGNAKALDMLARQELGIDPVPSRRPPKPKTEKLEL